MPGESSAVAESDEPPATAVESDGSTDAVAVCDLATDGEISAIVENDVVRVEIDATLCEYSLVGGAPGQDGTAVDVFANTAFDEVCSLEFDVAGTGDAMPVEGIGTIASWKSGLAQLLICTGTSFVTITQYKPSSVSDEAALTRATDIAVVILYGA